MYLRLVGYGQVMTDLDPDPSRQIQQLYADSQALYELIEQLRDDSLGRLDRVDEQVRRLRAEVRKEVNGLHTEVGDVVTGQRGLDARLGHVETQVAAVAQEVQEVNGKLDLLLERLPER